MKVDEYIPVKPAGGSNPDPATYCPTEGFYDPDDPDSPVIWNPINPDDGWFLIAEFDNNSPNSTTFDPVITASSGQYAWDLGDGTYLIGDKSISHTYLTTATRTVRLYGKGTCTISTIDFSGDNIVGVIDLSNSAFASVTSWKLQTNASLTGIIFPSTITAAVAQLYAYSTGITGTLDLSMFTSFSSSADIEVHLNSSMTGVTFASSITGTVFALVMYSTGITGTLDLSMFTKFATNAQLQLDRNASMTGITFANSITGAVSLISIYSCGITGSLDLSKFTTYNNTAVVNLYSNPSMTGVIFPGSTITGFIKGLSIYNCTSVGYVDLTKLKTGVASLAWDFKDNDWGAEIVNQTLVAINGISASGFTGRTINVGGTNTDPDSSSGGYDGVTARNNLITKAFTVTIT